jgi:hypothetical protein
MRRAVELQTARIGAPALLESAHDFDSGLAGRVAFCAAASCCALGSPSALAGILMYLRS